MLSWAHEGPAREDIRDEFTVIDDGSSSDQEVMNTNTRLHRLFEGGAVGDGLRIEDDDVSVGAFLQTSFLARGWSRAFEHLGRHESHFANRIHQAESLFLTNILRDDSGVGAGVARMPFGSVTGDHDE